MDMSISNLDTWLNKATALIVDLAPKLLMALVVLWVDTLVIRGLARVLGTVLDRRGVEPTLKGFLHSLVTISLRVLLFITVIGMVGIQTTSFVAIIGAAGLAVGLALQGILANFAGGTLILLFKPCKVGDLIEAQGVLGNVKEIQIFTTVLTTPENKTAIIPYGPMANGNIVNYPAEGRMRVDLTFGLGYTSSIPKAREFLLREMSAHPNVLQDPAPAVTVGKLNVEGLELAARPWCDPRDHWDVHFGIYEQDLIALQEAGVEGPQPSIRVLTDQCN